MDLLVVVLSRLVPLLLMGSVTLIGSRYIFDLLRLRGRPAMARWAFGAVMFLGILASGPYAVRSTLLIGGRWSLPRGRWQVADLLFTDYDGLGGRRSQIFVRDWAYARMNLDRWKDAEEVLRNSDEAMEPQTLLMIGICRYYAADPRAEQTLTSVPMLTGTQLCIREYLLGRIAQRRGDLAGAWARYGRSASLERNFFPAVYHGVRLQLLRRDGQTASRILNGFLSDYPGAARAADVEVLLRAVQSGSIPPDKEFIIVTA
jgi:hypothetical protein